LKYALSDEAKKKPFDPEVVVQQECLITSFQESYFISGSFQEAKEKMREYALKIKRPFAVRYNPYNQSIEILSNAQQVSNIVCDLKGDICIIFNALKKMEKEGPEKLDESSEETGKGENSKRSDTQEKQQNQKLIRNFKRLEEAFRNLSIDFQD
jgi:hypothetical protein